MMLQMLAEVLRVNVLCQPCAERLCAVMGGVEIQGLEIVLSNHLLFLHKC